MKLSRPCGQNGRSKKVKLIDIDSNNELIFPYIRGCALYLIDNGYIKNNVNCLADKIVKHIKEQKILFDKYKVEFI